MGAWKTDTMTKWDSGGKLRESVGKVGLEEKVGIGVVGGLDGLVGEWVRDIQL